MNAHTIPVRVTCAYCAQFSRPCDCDEAEAADTGMPSMAERAAGRARVEAILAAHPPKPDPTPEQIAEARRRADDAVRGLLSDTDLTKAGIAHKKALRTGWLTERTKGDAS